MPNAIFFDDGAGRDQAELGPLTDLRSSFDIRTGALTTIQRWLRALTVTKFSILPRTELSALAHESHPRAVAPADLPNGPTFVINGRCVLPTAKLRSLPMGTTLHDAHGDLAVGHAPDVSTALAMMQYTGTADSSAVLLRRPWNVRTHRDACLAFDQPLIAQGMGLQPSSSVAAPYGVIAMGDKGLAVSKSATVSPGVILDSQNGPISIDDHAVIRPGAILIGPCYVGPHSTVLERATIRQGTSIGPWCKVNGEVGGTIFQGYSNKAHDGYIGDSFVGEWANLGAGTTGSNLLNTYGEIISKATPDAKNERTGEQFFGAVIGDHVKTAICTRLMTGSVLGTGGMFATTAPVTGSTPRFAWATDAGLKSYRADKFLEVMRAAMARRKIEPSPAYVARMTALIPS